LFVLGWLAFGCGPADPEGRPARPLSGIRVHLTVDDAPGQRRDGRALAGAEDAQALNAALLGQLSEAGVSASVFFNCDALTPGDGLVEAWASAGHAVGNHTAGHGRLDAIGLDAWLEEVDRCHQHLAARLAEPPTAFRYPYLNHGTGWLREAATEALAARGYRNAPVTVATSEWVLAFAWSATEDGSRREALRAAYHQHLREALLEARALARRTGAGDPVQTLLVHANPMNAELLSEAVAGLALAGARFVSLEEASRDPVFERERTYAGGAGLSWLARTAPAGVGRPYWFGEEEGRLLAAFPLAP
jgi:peptidoglycan/xylan/chitin deacetylase (PgdA/CDA1 family)